MKKFENMLIVTDLDGTFLSSKDTLVERNLRAIEYFKQNGGHFTVASGRVFEHIIGAIPNIRELVNAPVISRRRVENSAREAVVFGSPTATQRRARALGYAFVGY